MANPASDTIYSIPRLSWVFGRFIRHSGWYPDRVLPLPKALTGYNEALVHEKVEVRANMKIVNLQGDLLHYTYRDLEHYLVKSAGYARAWADQRTARGKKGSLGQGLVHAVGCFLKMYLLKAGFLDGKQGPAAGHPLRPLHLRQIRRSLGSPAAPAAEIGHRAQTSSTHLVPAGRGANPLPWSGAALAEPLTAQTRAPRTKTGRYKPNAWILAT